jgi:acetyltransferase-like isoleucine patch superfamily enzyme
MKMHETVQTIMFDYEGMTREQLVELCQGIPRKLLRWLGANHPDMRTRRVFFELTNVTIGEGAIINQNLIVSDGYAPLLTIGDRVALSPNVTIICESEPNNSRLVEVGYVAEVLVCKKPVTIGDDAWVGANVVILPGVTIGAMSIVGAGAVVTHDVPPRTVVAGVPARVIRTLSVTSDAR